MAKYKCDRPDICMGSGCGAFLCMDCSANTLHIDEYYMVTDEVWESSVPERRGMLCIGCLEARLGRTLTGVDFPDYPINRGVFPNSDRLQSRLHS